VRVSFQEMRAVLAALAANLAIAIAKFVAFLLTGSASMLAESVHSVADTGNELLLLIGRGRSNRPASREHPFGFGRERYFYGFIVSVMLFTVGAAFSIYDGIHKVITPETIESPVIAFAVLGLSAIAEAFSLRTGIKEANKVRGNRGWGTFIRRSKAPELPVVLLEDTAALVGLVFAFAGVGLSVLTGDGRWDGIGSLAIGALLATAAGILAVEMKSLLIGEAASRDVQHKILEALEDGPELVRVIHLRTVHIGPDSVLVAAKVGVRETDTAAQIAAGINTAEGRVREAVPIATTIYLEPDIYHANLADQENPSIQAAESNRASRRTRKPPPPPTPALPAHVIVSRNPPESGGKLHTILPMPRREGRSCAPGEAQGWGAARLTAGQQAQSALLLEVQCPARRGRDAAQPPAQIGDGHPHRRLGQHPQAERQRRGADVVTPLEIQRGRHRLQVRLAELPVRRPRPRCPRPRCPRPRCHPSPRPPRSSARCSRPSAKGPRPDRELIPDLWQQPQFLAIAEHASRRSQPPGGLRDAHVRYSNNFLSRKPVPACAGPPRPSTVDARQASAGAKKEIACPWSTRSQTCRWPPSAARRFSWPSTRCRG
jgi:cation diffusion facilitator family transporter